MSNKEIVKYMIDKLPEEKMVFLINIIGNIGEMSGIHIYPDHIPNADTLAAFAEGNELLTNGTGQRFTNTKDLFAALEE